MLIVDTKHGAMVLDFTRKSVIPVIYAEYRLKTRKRDK
jgi:predicted transglutaminase-like cysteine proteinase